MLFVSCRQRVALPRRVARLYPAYGLYLYGEGLYAQETRALKLTGAPVLFLPGNAGSYKQGKSATVTEGLIKISFIQQPANKSKQGQSCVLELWAETGFCDHVLTVCSLFVLYFSCCDSSHVCTQSYPPVLMRKGCWHSFLLSINPDLNPANRNCVVCVHSLIYHLLLCNRTSSLIIINTHSCLSRLNPTYTVLLL